jgi:hypothetical protein
MSVVGADNTHIWLVPKGCFDQFSERLDYLKSLNAKVDALLHSGRCAPDLIQALEFCKIEIENNSLTKENAELVEATYEQIDTLRSDAFNEATRPAVIGRRVKIFGVLGGLGAALLTGYLIGGSGTRYVPQPPAVVCPAPEEEEEEEEEEDEKINACEVHGLTKLELKYNQVVAIINVSEKLLSEIPDEDGEGEISDLHEEALELARAIYDSAYCNTELDKENWLKRIEYHFEKVVRAEVNKKR